MPFEKGDPNINRNGRPLGSANKITEELREAFALTLQNKLPELEVLLARVAADEPAKALELILKLSNRFLPELSRQELTGANGDDLFKSLKFNFGEDTENTEDTNDNEEL
jgi:hypothetical protein